MSRLLLLPRRYLRKATRREHAAAEDTAVMRALLDGRLDAAGYIQLLLGYHALYAPWEAQQARWLAGDLVTAGWKYRSRLPAIERDLHALGAPLPGRSVEDALIAADAGSVPAWGWLYVVEGSALGGQVIARRLAAGFPGHAHLFFNHGHGQGNGQPTWREFQALMDAQLGSASARRAIALEARTAFGRFQKMLEGVVD